MEGPTRLVAVLLLRHGDRVAAEFRENGDRRFAGSVDPIDTHTVVGVACDPSFTIHGTALYAELEPAVFRPFAEAWREAGLPE